jgi:hypothetical protein
MKAFFGYLWICTTKDIFTGVFDGELIPRHVRRFPMKRCLPGSGQTYYVRYPKNGEGYVTIATTRPETILVIRQFVSTCRPAVCSPYGKTVVPMVKR